MKTHENQNYIQFTNLQEVVHKIRIHGIQKNDNDSVERSCTHAGWGDSGGGTCTYAGWKD